jgi:hypothetical protein
MAIEVKGHSPETALAETRIVAPKLKGCWRLGDALQAENGQH